MHLKQPFYQRKNGRGESAARPTRSISGFFAVFASLNEATIVSCSRAANSLLEGIASQISPGNRIAVCNRRMLSIAFSQSKYYVDNLSENVKRGIRQKLRRGERSWYAPLGYHNNPTTRNIEPDSECAQFIVKAFELYKTDDYTLPALQRTLEDLGLRTRKGAPLSLACVQALLKNPLHCGMMKINGELHQGAFEPLVSQDIFDVVQKVMSKRGWRIIANRARFPDWWPRP